MKKELMSVNSGGELLPKERETRLTAYGTQAALGAEQAWTTLSWVSVSGNLRRASRGASGSTEFSYNIRWGKGGDFNIKLVTGKSFGLLTVCT